MSQALKRQYTFGPPSDTQSVASDLTFQKPKTPSKFDQDRKMIIHRIVTELARDPKGDILSVIQRPHIQKLIRSELSLTDKEAKTLESQIVQNCEDLLSQVQVMTKNRESSMGSISARPKDPQKSQPLTMLQRKEFDHYDSLSYHTYPVQPGVRSLYYISRIAQTQSLKLIVPPTILIGFGDDNRLMWNDPQRGTLLVQSGYISPKIINAFIHKHMILEHHQQNIESRLLYPKFVIKLASKSSTKNELKIYFSKEALLADLMNFWGSFDMAIQIFIKQKHLRPSVYRYYMKNGHLVRAVAISNQENLTPKCKTHQTIMGLINEQFAKTKKNLQTKVHKPKQSLLKRRDHIKPSQAEQLLKVFSKRNSLIPQEPVLDPEEYQLDARGFPTNLELFKLQDFYSEISATIPNSELKKYYSCTSDFLDNLTMMNCRPGAQQQAEQMTLELYRLFTQYYLKIKRHGQLSHFVCDFMEAENGLLYLLQVKSFECEGVIHEWQQDNVRRSGGKSAEREQKIEGEEEEVVQCQGNIMCSDKKYEQLNESFLSVLKDLDMLLLPQLKKGSHLKASRPLLDKYLKELELGKEYFLLQSEKNKISPLLPLTTFCENKGQFMSPKKSVRSTKSRLSMLFSKDETLQSPKQDNDIFQMTTSDEVPVCQSCFKILELFSSRYYALVFKTEQTVEELRKLKLKMVQHWTTENIHFLMQIYKNSKKSLYITSDLEKLEKRLETKRIRQRARTPDSVTRKNIGRQRETLKSEFEKSDANHYGNSGSVTSRSKHKRLLVSKSLLKSIEQVSTNLQHQKQINPYFKSPVLPHSNRLYSARSKSSKLLNSSQTKSTFINSNHSLIPSHQNLLQVSNLAIEQQLYNQDDPYQQDLKTDRGNERGVVKINNKELNDVMHKFNLNISTASSKETFKTKSLSSRNSSYRVSSGVKQKIHQQQRRFMNALGKQNQSDLKSLEQNSFFNSRKQSAYQNSKVDEYFNQKRQLMSNQKKLQVVHRVLASYQEKTNDDLLQYDN